MADYYLEKMAQFEREHIVHAIGAEAYGTFTDMNDEITEVTR